VRLECAKPVAVDSPDHLHPIGAAHDNSTNPEFNRRLYALWPGRKIRVLDLGCAGGGFVEECIRDDNMAIGLEGSSRPMQEQRDAWARIPANLFTCDITEPFTLRNEDGSPARFDAITMWEVIEHIPREKLGILLENVRRHLSLSGVFVVSTTTLPSVKDGVDLHPTRERKEWWELRLAQAGLTHSEQFVRFFGNRFVRGDFETEDRFHLACTHEGFSLKPPRTPRISRYQLRALFDHSTFLISRDAPSRSPVDRSRNLVRFWAQESRIMLSD
jgi:SAM-dependent methyltransferase